MQSTMSCCPPSLTSRPSTSAQVSCCNPSQAQSSCGVKKEEPPVTREDVSEYYGKTIQSTKDLLTSACILETEEVKGVRQLVKNIHPEILEKFYGCGSPIPPCLSGATVVDLGCGTGRDVYTVSQLVGENGQVIGVDMTDEQLAVARKHSEWHRVKFGQAKSNVDFRKAVIEDLSSAGIRDSSVDVVISNCVLNLAEDKEAVLREVHRVLKEGGELFFSDAYTDRRVPEHLKRDKVLFGECLSGAMYFADFRRLLSRIGLSAWGVTHCRRIALNSAAVQKQVGPIGFYSLTVRALKLPPGQTEDAEEDYGQTATYKGTVAGLPEEFKLDLARKFPAGVPVAVDRSTAAALSLSRYKEAFDVTEGREHKGAFAGWPTPLTSSVGLAVGRLVAEDVEEEACCC